MTSHHVTYFLSIKFGHDETSFDDHDLVYMRQALSKEKSVSHVVCMNDLAGSGQSRWYRCNMINVNGKLGTRKLILAFVKWSASHTVTACNAFRLEQVCCSHTLCIHVAYQGNQASFLF